MSRTVSDPHGPHDAPDSPAADRSADDPDLARIEAALAETERGRRFLAAHARRHRGADTQTLLRAIGRLESVVVQETARHGTEEAHDRLAGLTGLAEAVAGTRAEIGADAGPGLDGGAPEPFEAAVQAAERTTSGILAASESIQETAWRLRETGVDGAFCDLLDHQAAAIGTACAAQDWITRNSLGIARTLSLLEARIAAMIARASGAGSDAKAGPRPDSGRPAPSPIPAEAEIAFAPASGAPPAEPDLSAAFADLDRLSIEEKIALFS